MLESLFEADVHAFVYVFAFDEICESVLKSWNHPRLQVISLSEFEDDELLAVKPTRSPAEYCWTCTPSVIRFCLKKYNLDACTYIDADLFFFSSPKILFEEMGDKSVLITEHRYTPSYDQSKASGVYCVQFIMFKANNDGLKALEWWRSACLDWCYARVEDGKFGDQKYLDDWLTRFKGVHVLKHHGGGVAPWNIQQYKVFQKKGIPFIKKEDEEYPVIFYHFHALTILSSGRVHFGRRYHYSEEAKKWLYQPYCDHLMTNRKKLPQIYPELTPYADMKDTFFKRLFNKPLKRLYRASESMSEKKYG